MALVLLEQVRVIGHHVATVKRFAPLPGSVAVLGSLHANPATAIVHHSLLSVPLRESLFAFAILEAAGIALVQHELLYQSVQGLLGHRVRHLAGDDGVNVIWCVHLLSTRWETIFYFYHSSLSSHVF
jgi:hypothetical protein